MEPQPYAATMQKELISNLESLDPDYIIFVTYPTSWIQVPKISTFTILHWWAYYQPKRYKQLVGVADIISDDHTEYRWSDAATYQVQSSSAVLIYKRTDATDDPLAGLNQADAKKAQDDLDEKAQENLQTMAIALDPDNYFAYNNLGILMYTRGLPEEAIKEFRISLTIQPVQSIVHYDIGKILSENRLFREAAQEFAQALQFAPGDVHAHNDLGVALFQLGDYENAAEQFGDAVRIDPAYVEANRNLSLAQARMKYKKAE
jgi:tetratricopeptide (TPR) repeat protein